MKSNRRWFYGFVIFIYLCSIGSIFIILSVQNSGKSSEKTQMNSTALAETLNSVISETMEAKVPIFSTPSPTPNLIELTHEPFLITPSPIPTYWPTETTTNLPTFTSTPTFEIVSLVPEFCTCKTSSNLYCGSFRNQTEAQACYIHCGGVNSDIYQLDKNENGIACGQWNYPIP